MDEAYEEGYIAFQDGVDTNPYDEDSDEYAAWEAGWSDGLEESNI